MPTKYIRAWIDFLFCLCPFVVFGMLGALAWILKTATQEKMSVLKVISQLVTSLFVSIIIYLIVIQFAFLTAEAQGIATGLGGYHAQGAIKILSNHFYKKLQGIL